MKKFLALVAIATLSFNAFAHGPTPQKSDNRIIIKADPAKVWAVVKDFNGVDKWLPSVKSIATEKKGEDSFRELTLNDGKVVKERLKNIDDGKMKIKYEIVDGAPVSNHSGWISVKAGPEAGESTVRHFVRFYRFYPQNPPIPEGQDDASAVKFIADTYEPGLEELKKVLENPK